jgi:hypothetical protein
MLSWRKGGRPTFSCGLRLEELEGRLLLTSYYLNPRRGSDTYPGTSPLQPWKTITRLNQANLEPGDTVYFLGGATFDTSSANFSLILAPVDTGTPTNPITLTSYGNGRATIYSGGKIGMLAQNVEGINVTNLIFHGSGMLTSTEVGIRFTNTRTDFSTLDHIYIDNVEVGHYGSSGILIEATTGMSFYRDVRITNSTLHHNFGSGLNTIGPGGVGQGSFTRTIFDLYVGRLTVYDNAGIAIGGVDGGIVERSVSYNTADFGIVVGAGIWAYNSSNVIIQHNEAYGVKGSPVDGNGFALDWDTINCTLQYNYAHNNDGAGFALFGSPGFGLPDSFGNTVRFNISENDARRNDYGAITVYLGVYDSQIYNNTVYLSSRPGTGYAGLQLGWNGSGLHIRNNIITTTGGVPIIQVPPAQGSDLVFQGNNYFSSSGPFQIFYNGQIYSSLSAWRNATNQEKLNGNPVGTSVDPQLTNPGGGGTLGNADMLRALTAYTLKRTSPLKNTGLNLSVLFGLDPGPRDFYGNLLPNGTGFSVGAHDIA